MKKVIKKLILLIFIIGLLAVGGIGYLFFVPNVDENLKDTELFLPKATTYTALFDSLRSRHALKSETTFQIASHILKYKRVKCGRYELVPGENNYNLVRRLRKGQHFPVKFTFNNVRTKEQFVQKTQNKFFFEPEELMQLLNNEKFLKKYDLTVDNCVGIFIPNTYEFYYDISAEDFFEKMYGYYKEFWTQNRLRQAKEIGLSPMEIVTLASIVEEENHRNEEKPVIAGLYLNRLRKGMLLQADPTVKFAVGDFSLTRVLDVHLQVDSPYNTYKYAGLPPGPIRLPEISSIEAVLHYTHHHYLYMCAKEDFSGYHNFAVTAEEHARNAARYRRALNRQGIK